MIEDHEEEGLHEEGVHALMLQTMLDAGTPMRLIYAWEKTRMLVDEEGYKKAKPQDRAEYDAAIEEFDAMTGQARRNWEHDLRKKYGA
jgi:hypothetical protein